MIGSNIFEEKMFWKTRSKLFWFLIAAIAAGLIITFTYFYVSETEYDKQTGREAVDSTAFQQTPANKANTQEKK